MPPESGKGAPKDKARARALLTKECTESSNEDACRRLGRKVPVDPDEEKAAPKKKKPAAPVAVPKKKPASPAKK